MQIASAKVVPWSSVVGSSVTLHDDTGKTIGQLAILGAGGRSESEALAAHVVEMVDNLNRHRALAENLHLLSTSNQR